jgi:hypothetical protein
VALRYGSARRIDSATVSFSISGLLFLSKMQDARSESVQEYHVMHGVVLLKLLYGIVVQNVQSSYDQYIVPYLGSDLGCRFDGQDNCDHLTSVHRRNQSTCSDLRLLHSGVVLHYAMLGRKRARLAGTDKHWSLSVTLCGQKLMGLQSWRCLPGLNK